MLFFLLKKCKNANSFWHFNIYEQEKFHAKLSLAWKFLIILGPDFDRLVLYLNFSKMALKNQTSTRF